LARFFYETTGGWGRWVEMTAPENPIARMERAILKNKGRISYDWCVRDVHRGHYVVDFVNMIQMNTTARTARSILRVVGDPPAFALPPDGGFPVPVVVVQGNMRGA
jgi:hypothetical protein